MELQFCIKNQTITRLDHNKVASYAKNYITCLFLFDEEDWGNLDKMALFEDANGNKYVVDLGYNLECRCNIPDDALKGNHVKVSAFAGDRMTSAQETVIIYPSGYDDEIDEIIHSENTADNEDVKVIKCNSDIDYRRIKILFDEEDIIPIRLNSFESQEHPY